MSRRKWALFAAVLSLIGLVLMFMGRDGDTLPTNTFQTVLRIIGMVLSVVGVILNLIFWRCPNCRKLLPWRNAFAITHCPWCMEQLDD